MICLHFSLSFSPNFYLWQNKVSKKTKRKSRKKLRIVKNCGHGMQYEKCASKRSRRLNLVSGCDGFGLSSRVIPIARGCRANVIVHFEWNRREALLLFSALLSRPSTFHPRERRRSRHRDASFDRRWSTNTSRERSFACRLGEIDLVALYAGPLPVIKTDARLLHCSFHQVKSSRLDSCYGNYAVYSRHENTTYVSVKCERVVLCDGEKVQQKYPHIYFASDTFVSCLFYYKCLHFSTIGVYAYYRYLMAMN